MPPLPGLRASSLPPAPGYESDEEGGLCNGKAERRTLQDVLPRFITLSVSRGHNERVPRYVQYVCGGRGGTDHERGASRSVVGSTRGCTAILGIHGPVARTRNTIDEPAAADFDLD